MHTLKHALTVAVLAVAMMVPGCSTRDAEPPKAAVSSTGEGHSMGFDAQALSRIGFTDPQSLRQPSHGLRVMGSRALSERAAELVVATDEVSERAPGGRNGLVVITPQGYDPSKRYPVVYLLPGTGSTDSPALQWYEAGQAQMITQGLPVITVAVSGGKEGWYTDWSASPDMAQNWETFHLDQVVPWVDAHLSTRADREHRLIMGNSMGGYGAVRYAQQRPDLFGETVSLSGVLDLSSDLARQELDQASLESVGSTDAVFGDGRTTTKQQWEDHNPLTQAEKLADVHVQMFVGTGDGNSGDIEPALRDTSAAMSAALKDHEVAFEYTEYGQRGACSGGHTFPCWQQAGIVALDRWAARTGIHPTQERPVADPVFQRLTASSAGGGS